MEFSKFELAKAIMDVADKVKDVPENRRALWYTPVIFAEKDELNENLDRFMGLIESAANMAVASVMTGMPQEVVRWRVPLRNEWYMLELTRVVGKDRFLMLPEYRALKLWVKSRAERNGAIPGPESPAVRTAAWKAFWGAFIDLCG